ncbi:MAG: protein kinase [Armatimonadetes bacterium]|nr:protein kinase [Anaerolineae bacterium]
MTLTPTKLRNPVSATLTGATSSTTLPLTGWRLTAARGVWWLVLAFTLVQLASSGYTMVQVVMNHYTEVFSPAVLETGLSAQSVALLLVIRRLISISIIGGVAGLIYRQRSNNLAALVVSGGMLPASTNIIRVNFETLAMAQAYTTPALSLLSSVVSFIGLLLMVGVFFFMPDGHFVPKWSKWALGLWVLVVAGILVLVPAAGIASFINALVLPFVLLGIYAQVYRYRHVASSSRQAQTRWVMIGLLISAAGYIVFIMVLRVIFPEVNQPTVAYLLFQLTAITGWQIALLAVPVTLAIALLRYGLWDAQVVLNRSLVYTALTVILGVLLFGGIALVQRLLEALAGGEQPPTIAIVGATLVIAGLFVPLRNRLQRVINHQFPGLRLAPATGGTPPTNELNLAFGVYQAIRLLGTGGMAEVYQARHPQLGREVAIKVLHQSPADQSEARARFSREARTVAALQHPNIVQVYDFGVQGDANYLVMEYIAGPTLAHYIREHAPLPLEQALPFIRDLAAALDYAHTAGVIHRDVKPSNVILKPIGNTYQAILTDFGVAKLYDSQTQLTHTGIVGTLDYLAPEQIIAPQAIDARADQYALAVVAYQLLTGRLPFTSDNAGAVLHAHLYLSPPDPRTLQPMLSAGAALAMLRALAKDPADRYATAGAFAAALAEE